MRRILLCQFRAGETQFTTAGLALLVGVTVDELLQRWDPKAGAQNLPPDLQRKGHKRTETACNATGENTATVILAYWAAVQWNARIDFDQKGGQLWAVIDGNSGGQ